VERIDADDLRRLAEASRAVLGSVARDSARYLARRAARGREPRRTGQPAPAGRRGRDAKDVARPRRRFKRRWVVVPTLVLLTVGLLAVLGVLWLLAVLFGVL
jgi:hypothetical protein